MLILPPLSQHLTFPLLSVTLLVSFGSSMLYGYNLAVVNSPAAVRGGGGQPLREQGKGLCIPPWKWGGIPTQQPHIKMLAFPLGTFLQRAARGEGWHGRDLGTCVLVHPPNWFPLEGRGWGKFPTTSLLQLQLCLWHLLNPCGAEAA